MQNPLSRRHFMQTTASGIAGAMLVGATQRNDVMAEEKAKPKNAGTQYIDAHCHVWTPEVGKYPLVKGFKKANMKPASFTPEQLFAHARPVGVSRVVLIQMSFYGFDNSYMLDMMKKHRGVFSGVAVIDEHDEPAARMRQLAKLGVRGFRIRSDGKNVERWLTGEGMRAMWKCGAREGLAMCHLINPDALPSVDRMCRKFPDTTVVIDHFARVGIDGRIRDRDLKRLCDLATHKNVSVKISAYYALGKKKPPYEDLGPMIRRLLDAFGPERLMWASDCPFQVDPGHNYAASIALVRDRLDFLSAGDREWILKKTAERVFFA